MSVNPTSSVPVYCRADWHPTSSFVTLCCMLHVDRPSVVPLTPLYVRCPQGPSVHRGLTGEGLSKQPRYTKASPFHRDPWPMPTNSGYCNSRRDASFSQQIWHNRGRHRRSTWNLFAFNRISARYLNCSVRWSSPLDEFEQWHKFLVGSACCRKLSVFCPITSLTRPERSSLVDSSWLQLEAGEEKRGGKRVQPCFSTVWSCSKGPAPVVVTLTLVCTAFACFSPG